MRLTMQKMALGIVGLAAAACLGVGLRHQYDAAAQPENPLSVSLGVPNGDDGSQFLDLTSKDAHVDVIVRNTSSHAVTLWQNNNSWGCSNVSLRVTALDSHALPKPIAMTVKPQSRYANPASTFLLRPGHEIVRALYFKDLMWNGHAYDGVPRTKDGKTVYEIVRDKVSFPPTTPRHAYANATIQAVFDIEGEPMSARYGVWRGRVESKPLTYNVRMPIE